MQKSSLAFGAEHDLSPATKHDVDMMNTERLMAFHQALVDRGQIRPIPPKSEWPNPGPKVDTETGI